jgi:hypothetical protein
MNGAIMSARRCMVSRMLFLRSVHPFLFFHDSNPVRSFSDSTRIRKIEIGHNLGLAHSGESGAYDDQSGMVSTFQLPLFVPPPMCSRPFLKTNLYQSITDGI